MKKYTTTRAFATTHVFARRVFGKCLRTPMCLRDDTSLRLACLREVSSRAHVSSRRRVSSPDLVFGKCLRDDACLHDDACLRQSCLREVSSPAHVSSRRRVPSPDLSSGSVFSDAHGFTSGQALARTARSGGVFAKTRVFATTRRPTRVFAGNVSSDAHVSSLSSPGMCLLTPTCLRRPCIEAQPWTPCVFKMCLRSSANMCTPPGDRNGFLLVSVAVVLIPDGQFDHTSGKVVPAYKQWMMQVWPSAVGRFAWASSVACLLTPPTASMSALCMESSAYRQDQKEICTWLPSDARSIPRRRVWCRPWFPAAALDGVGLCGGQEHQHRSLRVQQLNLQQTI